MKPLIADFYKTASLSLLVDSYFFIQRNCKTRLLCVAGAAFLACIQPLAILGASEPVYAQAPTQPTYLKQIPSAAPMGPTGLAELPPVVYVPPPPSPLVVLPRMTYANSYDWGNCTYYVASRISVPNNLGNAATWAVRAVAQGYSLGPPLVGAVAQSSRGAFGHVAIVVGVGAGTVTVDEMNVRGLGVVDEASYPVNHFDNYIYFR